MLGKMKVELIVFGGADFDPDRLQTIIGLVPDKVCHIGETIGRSIRKHESNAWIVSTGYSQCVSLTKCIVPLLSRLEPFWEKLHAAVPPNAEIQLSVAAYVYDSVPELNFEKHVLGRLAELGASLDIDVIVIGEAEGENGDIHN